MSGLVLAAEGETTHNVTAEYLAEDSGGTLIGISIAFAVLTTFFLGLRLFAKRFTAGGYGLDDYFLAAAYVVDLGMCAVGIGRFSAQRGNGVVFEVRTLN